MTHPPRFLPLIEAKTVQRILLVALHTVAAVSAVIAMVAILGNDGPPVDQRTGDRAEVAPPEPRTEAQVIEIDVYHAALNWWMKSWRESAIRFRQKPIDFDAFFHGTWREDWRYSTGSAWMQLHKAKPILQRETWDDMDPKPTSPEPDQPSTGISVPPQPKARVGRPYVVECAFCRGRGVRVKYYGDMVDRSVCPACRAKGRVTLWVTTNEMLRRCPYCRGGGVSFEIGGMPCETCGGVGAMALNLNHP